MRPGAAGLSGRRPRKRDGDSRRTPVSRARDVSGWSRPASGAAWHRSADESPSLRGHDDFRRL